jgi:1-deoxy-D-xylulose-5-phosphate reductoisomerase
MQKRRVVILGSTGSIGTSALKVARGIPDRMSVLALNAGRNVDSLIAQAQEFHPALVGVQREEDVARLKGKLPEGTRVVCGEDGLVTAATLPEADLVLIAIVGTAGLRPALAAIRAGKDIAVASKEILVMAGEIVMREAARHGVKVLPVDSEHNAVFQCLEGHETKGVSRILLTASGGPFRTTPASEFGGITPAQALKHPTWEMGKKITIDSATLFNKGLEMIEARWLFGLSMGQVQVVVHPQSIVHSMVEFVDGSILAQMSRTDMCFPIQYAVTYPERLPGTIAPLDFGTLGSLTFENPDPDRFPALRLAREAGERCGTLPAVLNAANEVAVDAFLHGRLKFPDIWGVVETVMSRHAVQDHPELDVLVRADQEARLLAQEEVLRRTGNA